MSKPKTKTGALLKASRERLGCSQQRLAGLSGVSTKTIARIEREERSVRGTTLAALAPHLGLTTSELVRGRRSNADAEGAEQSVLQTQLSVAVWRERGMGYVPIGAFVAEGDLLRISVHVSQPAFACVVWIDQLGAAHSVVGWPKGASSRAVVAGPGQPLHIPNVPDGIPGDLATAGPRGLETIVAMISRRPPTKALQGLLPNLLECKRGADVSVRLIAPIYDCFVRGSTANRRNIDARTPLRVSQPTAIAMLHSMLWSRLQEHFDQVCLCTFANRGSEGKD